MSQNYWNIDSHRREGEAEGMITETQSFVPQTWQLPLEPAQYPSYYELPMPQTFPYPRTFRAKTHSGDEIEYELRYFPGPIVRPPFYGPIPVIRPFPLVPPVPPIFW